MRGSIDLEFVVLAVTEACGGFCIAGMNNEGKWMRPLGEILDRFWKVTDFITKVDIGDVWEINGQFITNNIFPNHIEDFLIYGQPVKKCRLTKNELQVFLQNHEEDIEDLHQLIDGSGRSLCLIKVDECKLTINKHVEKKTKLSIAIENIYNSKRKDKLFPFSGIKGDINNCYADYPIGSSYLCFGKSTPNGKIKKEFPMVISLLTV